MKLKTSLEARMDLKLINNIILMKNKMKCNSRKYKGSYK